MIIALDFDGTCVTDEFPNVGKNIGAQYVLHEIVNAGHKIILHTMRSDIINPKSDHPDIVPIGGNYLSDAQAWLSRYNIPIYGVYVNPTQHSWTHSSKAYADMYIDNAALGCPLKNIKEHSGIFSFPKVKKSFVCWHTVFRMLINMGLIEKGDNYESICDLIQEDLKKLI